jgi:hypothetical protein
VQSARRGTRCVGTSDVASGIRWTGPDPASAAASLKAAQDDVRGAVWDVVRSLPDDLRRTFPEAARSMLPRRGGLADIVASAQLDVAQATAGDQVSVTVRATSTRVSLGPINAGDLRHPVYGSRRWVGQRVRPGVWDRACETAIRGKDSELREQLGDVARDTASRAQ